MDELFFQSSALLNPLGLFFDFQNSIVLQDTRPNPVTNITLSLRSSMQGRIDQLESQMASLHDKVCCVV